jgi:hypothetical protein
MLCLPKFGNNAAKIRIFVSVFVLASHASAL